MCPTTVLCRLCLCFSSNFKALVDETGHYNEIYDIVVNYFDAMLLTTEICLDCWQHIHEFYEYQQSVLKAQANLNDVVKIESSPPDLEMIQIDQDNDDNVNMDITRKDDLKDHNPFGSDDEILSPEYSNKKIREFEEQKIKETKNIIKQLSTANQYSQEEVNNFDNHDDDSTHDKHRFICSICNKDYKHALGLRRHISTHTMRDTYQCPYCTTQFQGKDSIPRHVRQFHPNEFSNFNNRELKSVNSAVLKDDAFEERTVEPDDNDGGITKNKLKYECSKCNKKYTKASDLRSHAAIHTNDGIYHCRHCSAKYTLPRNLRRHIKIMHPEKYVQNNRKRERILNFNNRELTSLNSSETNFEHLNIIEENQFNAAFEEKPAEPNGNDGGTTKIKLKYECSKCDKKYAKACDLRSHAAVHTKEDIYHCPHCSAKYSLPRNLRRHIRILHPEKYVKHNKKKKVKRIHSSEDAELENKKLKILKLDSNMNSSVVKDEMSYEENAFTQLVEETSEIVIEQLNDNTIENSFNAASEKEAIDPVYHAEIKDETSVPDHKNVEASKSKRKFKCTKCDKSYNHSQALSRHNATHTVRAIYKCPYCPTKFQVKDSIPRHVKHFHSSEFPNFNIRELKSINSPEENFEFHNENTAESKCKYKCSKCGKEYTSRSDFRDHTASHKNEAIIRCPYCRSKFTLPRTLRRHIKTLHPEKYVEPNSDAPVDLNLLGRHLTNSDPALTNGGNEDTINEELPNYNDYDAFIAKWKPELECDICKTTFECYDLLNQHFRVEHPRDKCHVVCCEQKILFRIGLVDHIRLHLDSNSFKCKICGKCSDSSNLLLAHMRSHSYDKHDKHEKQFHCEICQKDFRTKSRLLFHSGIHSTEKNHFCKICNKGFSTIFLLKKHEYLHKEYEFKHLCDQCGESCFSINDLKEHLLKHDGIEMSTPKWPCKLCGERFRTRLILKNHKHTYHGANKTPCVCSKCGEKCPSKRSLKRHKRDAHGRQRKFKCNTQTEDATHYQCPHCPLILKQQKNVPRHIQIAHPTEFANVNYENCLTEQNIDIRMLTQFEQPTPVPDKLQFHME